MASFQGTVIDGSLNLRASASTGATKLASIPNGTSLTVQTVSGDQTWFKTTYSSQTGYVVAQYIAITSDGGTCTVTTSSGSLNIRKTASTSAARLYQAAKGSTLRLLDSTSVSGWYRVSSSEGTGWASSSYLTIGSSGGSGGSDSALQAGHYVMVSEKTVNVRKSTSTSSTRLGKLLYGTKLYCKAVVSSSWVKVGWGGISTDTAYIKSEYLTDGGSAPSSKAQRAIDIGLSMVDVGYLPDDKIGNLGLTSDKWCVQYASWLMKAAGCSSFPDQSTQALVSEAADFFKDLGTFGLRGEKTPKKGDWVFFSKGDEEYQHVGLVTAVSGTKITTVEGNLGGEIKSRGPQSYNSAFGTMTVYGFGTPTWT